VVATFERSRLRGSELLRAVAEGTAREVGEAFLHGLVRSVAEALAAKLVLVAEATDPDGIHVKVVAGWYDGAPIEEPFEYDTAGQPCALVPGQTLVSFPEGLVRHFPEDQGAVEMGLESYLAVCLRDSQSTYLGHLAVLDSHRMEAEPEDVAVLKIFAARAGAELERRKQAAALQASRARVIEAADAERRRMGRDLHDGAQQRLLAVSNLLRVARRKPESAESLLELAETELTAAHAELRELARGLHPVALSERGLRSAIESLIVGSEPPVTLDVNVERLPDDVELATYFIVSESLMNARRYADCEAVHVRVAPENGALLVEIADDGCGGADPTAGTGLRGLTDRIDALGGRLEVDSPVGAGTRVSARLPLRRGGQVELKELTGRRSS
jgi:signal transduction histidine kinase